MGIDEAGRGCVIGPLVIGMVVATEPIVREFEAIGITDSKKLSKNKRIEFRDIIAKRAEKIETIAISPAEIDAALKDHEDNLNQLELRYMTNFLANNVVSKAYVDAISTPRYSTSFILNFFKQYKDVKIKRISNDALHLLRKNDESSNKKSIKTTIIAQNKADSTYKVVSAASIMAKTDRDESIRKLEDEYSLEKGILASGYANEFLFPFLRKYSKQIKNKEFEFIRYRWMWDPLQHILQGRRQQKRLKL